MTWQEETRRVGRVGGLSLRQHGFEVVEDDPATLSRAGSMMSVLGG